MDLLDEARDIRKRNLIIPGWKPIWPNHFIQFCGHNLDVVLHLAKIVSRTLMGFLHDFWMQSHHLEE